MKKIKLLLQWYWIKRTNEFRATYDSDQAWARIQQRIHQRQRIKVFYRYGAAACIFGLVALSAGFFYTYRHHTSEIAEILARTPSNKAVLHLENGRIYNLENTPPPLLLDYESLLNSQKTMIQRTHRTNCRPMQPWKFREVENIPCSCRTAVKCI